METLLTLGFPEKDQRFWMRSLAKVLAANGDSGTAKQINRMASSLGSAGKSVNSKKVKEAVR